MKLTQKDRITLTVLAIALTLFIGIWFIVRPAFKEVQESKKTYNEQRSVYQQKEKELQEKENVKQQIQTTYDESIKIANKFYDNTTTYDMTHQVYEELTKCNINVTASNFTLTAKTLSPYTFQSNTNISLPLDEYANINGNHSNGSAIGTAVTPQQVGCYTFNISFVGATREDIFTFLEDIKTLDHATLVISNLSFNVSEAESEEGWQGSITLELYYMTAPDEPVFD